MSWHFWDRVQARGRRKRRKRKRGGKKKKRWGEIKEGRRTGKEKSPFSTSHSCVFPQPGKHINPSAFRLGNKGTQPDCGGKGDKKDPGTLKRERARFRESWDFTFRGALCCRHRDWHTQTREQKLQTNGDAKTHKDSSFPLILLVKKVRRQPEERRKQLGPQVRTGCGSVAPLGAGAAAHPPFVLLSRAKENEAWEEKYFI